MSTIEPGKVYIGDGVYADNDGYAIHLTTENGLRTTNSIVLEPEIVIALVEYARRIGVLKAPAARVSRPTSDGEPREDEL